MKSLIVGLVLLLSACATAPLPEQITVKAPTPPVIEMPAKPDVPKDVGNDEKVKAIMDYILELRARLEQAINALEVYR